MFWRKKQISAAPPQVGCFGKLPATGDFVRLNAGGEELASFDRWLGDSIDFARRSLGPAFDAPYSSSVGLFIYRGERRGDKRGEELPARGLVGAWAASGDNAGRLYPMVVFASYDYTQLVATGAALPIALWPLLTAAYDVATAGRHMAVEPFLDRVARIACPSLEDPEAATASYRSWLEQQTMKAFWDTAFGEDSSRFWALSNLAAAVEPFRGQELPKTGLALRVPLGAGDAYAAAVWMDMTQRLSRYERTLFNCFWSPQKSALVHLGSPHVASFRELIAPSANAEHIADLCVEPTMDEAAARRSLGGAREALVANVEMSLSGYLDGLS